MHRPTRDELDRRVRAAAVAHGIPVERTDDRPRFDAFHEALIAWHVVDLVRLWSLVTDTLGGEA